MNPHPLEQDLDHILNHTRGLWEELRGARLFLTGGTGFFGCWLLESFTWANDRLGLGAEAVVLTRNPEAFHKKAPHLAAHPAVRLYAGDVRDFAFPPGAFSHVIHAATDVGNRRGAPEQPMETLDTIVTGTRRVLDFAAACGTPKLLLASSGTVYGRQQPELTHLPETYSSTPNPLEPLSAYGEGKRLAENLCAQYLARHGIQTKIARGFAFVGPYLPLDAHFAVGNFIRDALRGGPVAVNGDGTPYRSYLYAADLAVWLWTILFRAPAGRPYNVGSGEAVTILETARIVAATATPPRAVTVAQSPGLGPPQRYVPDVARAKAELGLEPTVPLAEAIRRTLRYYGKK